MSLLDLLEENPSLNPLIELRLAKAYPLAVLLAVKETNLEETTFPVGCPYSREQILDKDYYPV